MYDHRSKSSELIVLHLLRRARRPMTPDDVEWIESGSSSDVKGYDTYAEFRGVGRFSGLYRIAYNRQDINEVVNGLFLTIPHKEYRTSHEVMVEVNARYGFKLEEYEVEFSEFGKQGAYTLKITDESPIWKGSFTVYREAAENSIVRNFDTPATVAAPLVTNAIREKISGDLIYEPYEFGPLRDILNKFVAGPGQEYQILDFLKKAVSDPWINDPIAAKPWNISGAVIKLNTEHAWNVVEIHLTSQCTNVSGYLKFKYIAQDIKGTA